MKRKEANQLIRSLMIASWKCGRDVMDKAVTNEAYGELLYVEKSIQRKIEDALCENQWIPLAEGLPEPNETVEIWVPSNIYSKVVPADLQNHSSGRTVWYGASVYPLDAASHWREIVGPREEN